MSNAMAHRKLDRLTHRSVLLLTSYCTPRVARKVWQCACRCTLVLLELSGEHREGRLRDRGPIVQEPEGWSTKSVFVIVRTWDFTNQSRKVVGSMSGLRELR